MRLAEGRQKNSEVKLRPAEGQRELHPNAPYCWFRWVRAVGVGTLPKGSIDLACSAAEGCCMFQSQEHGQPVLNLWEGGAPLAIWVPYALLHSFLQDLPLMTLLCST